jgi:hypothetical protein
VSLIVRDKSARLRTEEIAEGGGEAPPLILLWRTRSAIFVVWTEKRREKVVVLRELQRGIIYTRELSKQAIEGHVSTAFIVYLVYKGARLTYLLRYLC